MKPSERIARLILCRPSMSIKATAELIARETGCDSPKWPLWPLCPLCTGELLDWYSPELRQFNICCPTENCGAKTGRGETKSAALAAFLAANPATEGKPNG